MQLQGPFYATFMLLSWNITQQQHCCVNIGGISIDATFLKQNFPFLDHLWTWVMTQVMSYRKREWEGGRKKERGRKGKEGGPDKQEQWSPLCALICTCNSSSISLRLTHTHTYKRTPGVVRPLESCQVWIEQICVWEIHSNTIYGNW